MAAFDQSVGGVASLEAVLLLLATSSLILRFTARFRQGSSLGVDDWLMVPAWLCFIGIIAIGIYGMTHHFVGYPTPADNSLLESIIPTFLQVFYVLDMLSTLSLGFTRLSALFFYRRVFVLYKEWDAFSIANIVLIILVVLWTLGYVLLQVFGCGSQTWELFQDQAINDCVIDSFLESVAISSFILDCLVLILPIPKIWGIQTSIARRLAITAIFLLAAAGIAASCTRMVVNVMSVNARNAHIKSSEDLFLFDTKLLYYLTMEAGLVQIAVNLPSLWYLRKGIRVESILKSIRSLISIHSTHDATTGFVDASSKELDRSESDVGRELEMAAVEDDGKQPTNRDRFEKGEARMTSSSTYSRTTTAQNYSKQ